MAFRAEEKYISVSSEFINEYMPSAHGEYVKVYLYGLAAAQEGRSTDNTETASLLNILVTDVENAWSYWQEKGLVKKDGEDIVFTSPLKDRLPAPEKVKPSGKSSGRPPHISSREVMKAREINPSMKDTITMVEQLLARPLSTREITAVFDFMSWYGMDGSLVLMLFEYCISMDKKNFAYIEKVAESWHNEGINDIKSAEAVIKRATEEKKFRNKCMRIFGLERNFSPSELKYINSWKTELGFTPEMVECAYDITVKNTGKAALAYMNKILLSWHQKGIKTPGEIKEKDVSRPGENSKIDEQVLLEMHRRMEKEKK